MDWLIAMFLIHCRDAISAWVKGEESREDELVRSLTYRPTILKRKGFKLIQGDKISEVQYGDR